MKTKKKSCRRRTGCKRTGCKRTGCKRTGCKTNQVGGAIACASGLCGASIAKMGSFLAAGSIGGYKVLSMRTSMKTKKKGKKNKLSRHQRFKYIDNSGKEIDFEIRQNDKKITIKNGKKKINKTYKKLQSATNRYDRKIKECMKKGFDKC